MLTFETSQARQIADQLMQPALIRVIDNIRKQLDQSDWRGSYQETQSPFPGHELRLTRGEQERVFNIWELCFCVCFKQFPVDDGAVEIDASLIDTTMNDVDWLALDTKAKAIVDTVFQSLEP